MDIIRFIIDGFISILISILLLIIGLIFVPNNISIRVLKFLKPSIIEKINESYKKFISVLTNLYINKELIVLDGELDDFNKDTKFFLIQNEKIEKNIYVIDLCKDMLAMLGYVVPRTIGGNGYDVYEQSLEYLYYYSNIIEPIVQDRNFEHNFQDKIMELRNYYEEIISQNDVKIRQTTIDMRDYFIKPILKYLDNEKEKMQNIYSDNKEKLVDLVKDKYEKL